MLISRKEKVGSRIQVEMLTLGRNVDNLSMETGGKTEWELVNLSSFYFGSAVGSKTI
jgi:hypothetical protein